MQKLESELAAKLGRDPTEKELSEQLGYDSERLKVEIQAPVSIDEQIAEGRRVEDVLPSKMTIDTECKRLTVAQVLQKLSGREREVLALKFGLLGYEYSFREISEVLGLSVERVRKIYVEALEKANRLAR